MAESLPKPKQKPNPQTPDGLAEVERALSVLQGRHPEHERLRREDEAHKAKRQAEIEATVTAETRRLRTRAALIGAGALAALVVLGGGGLFVRSELARRSRIDQATEAYRALGFTLVETSSRSEPSKLEASVSSGCLLAVSTSSARIRIAYTGGTTEGSGPVMTCLCEGAKVDVSADLAPGEGLALLTAEAGVFGGSRAFAFLPFKPGTLGRADQACAETSLDAWLDAKRWAQEMPGAAVRPSAPADGGASDRWLGADPRRSSLRNVGFKLVATVKREAPFAVVEVPAETCVLLSAESPADKASLRLKGGSLAVGPTAGNAGWCTSTETLALVQHEGGGELAVLFAPAARVGGLTGLSEATESAGLPLGAATVAASDRGWSAKQLLLASAIPETLISVANAPDLGVDPEARVVALSSEKPNSLVAETPPDVFSFCDPPLDRANASVCVFSGTQKWRVEGAEAVAGLARAKLPFWLFGLQGVSEPVALKLATDLVTLARKLRRDGFEPTTIEAVTELDKGVEVLGRANEDAMVVVGLAPAEPWILPYTDGPAWTLDGEPRVIPIKPLERITVTSTKKLPPKAVRRTVVFRRQKR